jgi:hypothetical protein
MNNIDFNLKVEQCNNSRFYKIMYKILCGSGLPWQRLTAKDGRPYIFNNVKQAKDFVKDIREGLISDINLG